MAGQARQGRMRTGPERGFFLGLTLLIVALVVTGFWPSWFGMPFGVNSPETYLSDPPQPQRSAFMLHGALASAWLVLIIVQAGLITQGRVALHRRLGQASAVLVPAIFLSGVAVSVLALRGGFHGVGLPAPVFVTVPLFVVVMFAGFATAGILTRRQPQAHKRWMLLATIAIADAGVGRVTPIAALFPSWFVVSVLLVLPLFGWDLATLGRLHKVTLFGGGLYISAMLLAVTIGQTAAWQAMLQPLSG